MNKQGHIAHISDVHIRFGSRHDEYKLVFQRTIDDLKKSKPKRIVITGDLFHIKITLSPKAIELAGWFLEELSKIAPVDILLGNHDLNLQSLNQGNSISPIISLLHNGYLISKENEILPIPETGNGIYFFINSGFYNVEEDLVYGIYSCIDGKIISLTEKEKDKKYIALYHGPVYGCLSDNGFELKGDELMKLSSFNNFDIVMLGDIHEHQSFRDGDIAFAGSLIQQNYGESIDKGYLMWNLSTNEFQRKFIPNDYGFSKLNISVGENVEERLEDLKFSIDKKKTKVLVELEDYEENYSVEKLKQLEKYIKNKHNCEFVNVNHVTVHRNNILEGDDILEESYEEIENFEDLLTDYLKQNNYDDISGVVELAREIDKKLQKTEKLFGVRWEFDKMEISNLFSFAEKPFVYNFNKHKGLSGIFGENYSGKSNLIKALFWILYQKSLSGGDGYSLVNLYTNSDKAYGIIYFDIGGEKYRITRKVRVSKKKDGSPKVDYSVSYEKKTLLENGDYKWIAEDSDEAATEKKEVSKVIKNVIGDPEDFLTIALQAQKGKSGKYASMSQQPKNDLINKYMGLEVFRDRYDVGNETFKKIKTTQKTLGDPAEYEEKIKEFNQIIEKEEKELNFLSKEKEKSSNKIDSENKKILEKTKQLIKIEKLEETDENIINKNIANEKNIKESEEKELIEVKSWLTKNFKKELPDNYESLETVSLESKLLEYREGFSSKKENYTKISAWLKENKKEEEKDSSAIEDKILEYKEVLNNLKNQLEISKGKKCPTCGHVEKEPDKNLEEECGKRIKKGEEVLKKEKELLEKARGIIKNNNFIDSEKNKLDSLEIKLKSLKESIDKTKKDIDTSKKIDEIKNHNKEVESKTLKSSSLEKSIMDREKEIDRLNGQIDLLKKNKDALENNKKINSEISDIEYQIKIYKTEMLQLDDKIKESSSNKSVANNNIENFQEKLNSIRNAEKLYKKYSIYLQAVHRDGIPSQIIRNKLPIVNHKINNTLKGIARFKVNMYVKPNGDIKEGFYYSEDKSDMLPLSESSGSQEFIISVAIRDALHFVSKLTKPSICIIDEGFGSLDDKHIHGIKDILDYLKIRYKNVWIITHRNEVKDFVDNIIHVTKKKDTISEDILKKNSDAGITYLEAS